MSWAAASAMAFTAAAVGLVAFTTSSVHAEAGYVMASSNPPCTSQIYCSGPLLDTVQRARLFNDSKTFVDMPTRRGQYEVLSAFDQLGTNATQEDVANFVAENFDSPDGELALVEDLPEWQADPPVLSQIADPHLSIWAKSLNFIWTKLYRISKPHQICNECLSSSITVQRGFIVPGGRFREFYYWDTYWIVLGLLASDLHQIAIDMVENMLDVVETFGFFPNGGRIYYLNRSQPPMLTAMVREVVAATDNVALLRRALPILEMEHDWWMSNRIVAPTFFPNGTLVPTLNATDPGSVDSRFALNAFVVAWEHPRPESYMEDVATTQVFANDTLRRKQAYRDIAAGAESGWDFSTRWLNTTLPDGTHNAAGAQLTDIITSDILPVDLNSILYDMEMTMANFHGRVGTPAGQQYFSHAASRRAEAMDLFLFDPATACWNDARLSTGEQNAEWYPSNVHPMWTGAHGTLSAPFARNGTLCPKLLRDVETYHTGLPSSE
ncbi:glycoside hydrolase, partial [Caulochytrium protostelioides]